MRTILMATTALSLISVTAHAQLVVLDPAALVKTAATVVNTAQEVQNGYREISGMIHGNGFGSLIPGLNSNLASNPIGDATAAAGLMSGSGNGGVMSGLFNRFLGQTQTYQPTGDDAEATMLRQRAQAAAGQLAVATQSLNGSSTRLSLLPGLVSALGGTADIKDAMDANTRASAEQMTQGAQSSQLQAMAIYQQAEANAQRSREELSWRQGAEATAASAQTAADNAANGQINLVTN